MENIFWSVYCHIANCGRKGESVDNSKRIMFSVHLFCLRHCTLKHNLIGVGQTEYNLQGSAHSLFYVCHRFHASLLHICTTYFMCAKTFCSFKSLRSVSVLDLWTKYFLCLEPISFKSIFHLPALLC